MGAELEGGHQSLSVQAYREVGWAPRRLFVVGDIHACPDEPQVLLRYLMESEGLGNEDLVIFIGDYIDRGPDSKGVVDLLLDFQERFPGTMFLRGNHEDMLLGYIGLEGSMGKAYLFNGGVQFLMSYGLSSLAAPPELAQQLPLKHLEFFKKLERYVIVGDYICAHAGLNPLKDLYSQADIDLFWIRQEFVQNIHHFEKTIIFGHTPYHDVMFDLPYKIGIDTGLVFGNMLTCVDLVNKNTYQVERGEREVKVKEFPELGRVYQREE